MTGLLFHRIVITVVDFFAGSSTSRAEVLFVLLNRRW